MITSEALAKLGTTIRARIDRAIRERSDLETQMLKNLRQYQAMYDPEIEKLIPMDKSRVYPRDTRVKVKGGVAKMMELMLPAQEENWDLTVSAIPSIPQKDLENVIAKLQNSAVEAAAQTGTLLPILSEDIEKEVKAVAEQRKDRMYKVIKDQLGDPYIDYPQLCKRVIRSGFIYGWGVVRSPMVRSIEDRAWVADSFGRYTAKTRKIARPYPEFVRTWDFYPDLSAKTWEDQDAGIERFIFNRHDFAALAKRSDFKTEVIKEWLRNNRDGNCKAKSFESDLKAISKTGNISDVDSRRYEVFRFLGFVSAHDVAAVIDVPEEEMHTDILADIWLLDDIVIKAEKAAFGIRPCGNGGQYHAFIYAEDEDSGLTGVGLPQELRDSQMSKCVVRRALMDNIASVAGPIFEVNTSLLARGKKSIGPIHAFKVIEREGEGATASAPAIRAVYGQSHIEELLSTDKAVTEQLDIESNLPAWTFGAMNQLKEGVRTSFNMSQMTGGANMVTKDIVRAFDRFTSSVIGSLLEWNMEFNEDDSCKGDYQVRAKGNISLVAREVRGLALDQFITTLTPEDRAMFDMYGINLDRLKSRDLPVDRMLTRDEAEAAIAQMREAASKAAQLEQGLTEAKTADAQASAAKKQTDAQIAAKSADAVIQEIMSRVSANMANAKSQEDKNWLENMRMLLDTTVKSATPSPTPAKRRGK